ncbi:MAG: polysaccharide deacetylase family protein [Clostridia bacterium]|nr:polysaccharide deacetylase family protein [Clostridia bacterium]
MRKMLSLLLAVLLAASFCIPAAAEKIEPGLPLQECHRVTSTKQDTKQKNGSVIRLWTLDTYDDAVDAELAALTQEYVDRLGPELPKAGNATSKNSRLEVEVRYSRTGLTWMSFLVQARTTYHRKLVGQEITSRTYDMTTGQRVYLTDIFDEGSEGWNILRTAVDTTVRAYFPDENPDEEALAALLTDEGLRNLDFTLHGLSLVIHIPAGSIYAGKNTLIEVPLYYPDIRPYMTMRAFQETDNLTYYKTVALTFDDGPNRTNTTIMLNNLLETGTRATFFVLGNRIKDNADLVQREHDEGHAVASHNYTHGDVSKMSGTAIRNQKTKFDAACLPVLGISARYARVPYGLYPQMIKANGGMPLIQWSVDTYDWREERTNGTILKNVKKQFTDGDIVLMHDIKDRTPKLAKALIEWLQEEGYMILTIDELFAKDGVVLEENVVYFRCEDGVTTIKKR